MGELDKYIQSQRVEPRTAKRDLRPEITNSPTYRTWEAKQMLSQLPVAEALEMAMPLAAYSPEAEASVFSDSLKGIAKFLAAHGTPHVFPPTKNNPLGEFNMSKLSTGEGYQAFMPGHYLAGDPNISRVFYRDRLTRMMNAAERKANDEYVTNSESVKSHLKDLVGASIPKDMREGLISRASAGKSFDKTLAKLLDPVASEKFWKSKMDVSRTDIKRKPFELELNDLVMGTRPEDLYSSNMLPMLIEKDKHAKKSVDLLNIIEGRYSPTLDSMAKRLYSKDPVYLENGVILNKAEPKSKEYLDAYNIRQELVKSAEDTAKNNLLSKYTPEEIATVRSTYNPSDHLLTAALIQRAKRVAAQKALSENPEEFNSVIKSIEKPELNPKQGALYTVEVGASPSNMLPLDMQLKELKMDMPDIYDAYDQALKNTGAKGLSEYRGRNTPLNAWQDFKGDPVTLMNSLNEQGVVGNLHLAKGHRNLNTDREFDPSAFNFVMFNDEVPKIIDRELGKLPEGYAEGGLARVSHSDLYQQRSRGDQSVAPQEHRAFAREWTQENPMLAVPSLLAAIPAYSAAKALGLVRSRTPASLEQMTEGYLGILDGLTNLWDNTP